MSLYQVQKLLYQLNRDPEVRRRYEAAADAVLGGYPPTQGERMALRSGDIGLPYVIGRNGENPMHFAAPVGMPLDDYLQAMREGVRRHGRVRAGIYALADDA